MKVTKRMSVAAVMAVVALLGAALFGGAADAAKKKGGAKAKTLRGKSKPIPDSTQTCVDKDADGSVDCTGNGREGTNGILSSPIKVPKSLDGAKVKKITGQVSITHPNPADLSVFLVGVGGKIVTPYAGQNYVPGAVLDPHFQDVPNLGPTTFDDAAALAIDDRNSCPNLTTEPGPGACTPGDTRGDGGGIEAFSPFVGSFKPADGTMNSLAKKLKAGQQFWLLVFDNDPAGTCSLPGCTTGDPADTLPDVPDTGSATWSLKITPKGGKK